MKDAQSYISWFDLNLAEYVIIPGLTLLYGVITMKVNFENSV